MLLTIPEHYAQMLNTGFDHRLYPFPLKSLQQLEIHMYWHESAENDPPTAGCASRSRKWWTKHLLRLRLKCAVASAGSEKRPKPELIRRTHER